MILKTKEMRATERDLNRSEALVAGALSYDPAECSSGSRSPADWDGPQYQKIRSNRGAGS